jgi:hypothetical protein
MRVCALATALAIYTSTGAFGDDEIATQTAGASHSEGVSELRRAPGAPAEKSMEGPIISDNAAPEPSKSTHGAGEIIPLNFFFGDTTSPAPIVVRARLSKEYLADYVERSVDRTKEVRDVILGTRIVGESRTVGKTRLVLHDNDNHATGEVIFEGTVHAKTLGRNGPARLNYVSDSRFQARKRILIGDSGLHTKPATADAPTKLTLTGVRTTLPGLRGRIAQRIATRRAGQSRFAANAVASDHTAEDVRHDLDSKLNEAVVKVQNALKLRLESLRPDDIDNDLLVRSRSTSEFIEVAVCHPTATSEEVDALLAEPLIVEGDPHIAVRIHRSAAARLVSNSGGSSAVLPLVGHIFVGGSDPAIGSAATTGNAKLTGLPTCSLDGEWIALEFSPSEVSAVQVAAEATHEAANLK